MNQVNSSYYQNVNKQTSLKHLMVHMII